MPLLYQFKEPIVVKESSLMDEQLLALEALKAIAPPEKLPEIDQELRNLKAGSDGENKVMFELQNSHMPLCILRDLHYEFNGQNAQIDFVVVAGKYFYVLECKQLYGDIEIDKAGNFYRLQSYNGQTSKMGIYSPVTQNQRHFELFRRTFISRGRAGLLLKSYVNAFLPIIFVPLVVIANEKTVLHIQNAPREVRKQIVRADQLINYIRRKEAGPLFWPRSQQDSEEVAKGLLKWHVPHYNMYLKKFGLPLPTPEQPEQLGQQDALLSPDTDIIADEGKREASMLCPFCGAPMRRYTARKGKNAGKPFYGCVNYPSCRGLIDVADE